MNQLVPQQSDLSALQFIARTATSSGLYSNSGNEQKILMILLAAQELGIKPMTALNGGIWNIQGKIEISARLMNSMIRKAGHSITIKEINNKICILEGKRADNGDTCTSQFTIEEATKAGLASRDVWKKYTEDMLYARAMSRLARRLFSDVIGTAYVEGEIKDANIIDVSPEPTTHIAKVGKLLDDLPQEHIVDANEMIEIITQEQWDSLKVLISQCSDKFQENVWNGLETNDVNDETYPNMGKDLYMKITLACQGHLMKKKKEENEKNKAQTEV